MSEIEAAGYGNPPMATRFQKGQSGNPRGRPRKRHREIPYDAVLGQMVTIREDGREKRITAAEAFILQLTQRGLAGDSAAARASLEAIEAARAKRAGEHEHMRIVFRMIAAGVTSILDTLGIGTRKYPADEKWVRWELQPWAVEAALERLDDRRLTEDEQREVWRATRTPHKIKWPEWWIMRA